MGELRTQGGRREAIALNDSMANQNGPGAQVLPRGEDGAGFTQNNFPSEEVGEVSSSNPKGERGKRGLRTNYMQ